MNVCSKSQTNSRVADLDTPPDIKNTVTETNCQMLQTLRTSKPPVSRGLFRGRHDKPNKSRIIDAADTKFGSSRDECSDEHDPTEGTTSETEISDSLHGSSWHSSRGGAAAPLRVAPHQALHEEGEDDDAWRIVISDLQYHRILGEGYFGQVWLVSESSSSKTKEEEEPDGENKVYALKKLSKYHLLCEDQVENTLREKQILQRLHHPGIVRLVAAHQDDSFLYLLQDFCQGGELFSLLHNNNNNHEAPSRLPERQCQFYTACLTDALWYIHCQNIVYRDLKPENILINAAGYPVLVDFGYAKVLEKGKQAYTLCGTPKYLAPEIIQGGGHTYSVDYWALGVIVYEMLCGEHPFEFWEMDDLSLFGSIVEAEYLALPEDTVSAAAIDLVDQLLVKNPARRLGSTERADHNEILQHQWLLSQDVPALRRQLVRAPWIPVVQGVRDDRHFDFVPDEEDGGLLSGDGPPLTMTEQAQFAGF